MRSSSRGRPPVPRVPGPAGSRPNSRGRERTPGAGEREPAGSSEPRPLPGRRPTSSGPSPEVDRPGSGRSSRAAYVKPPFVVGATPPARAVPAPRGSGGAAGTPVFSFLRCFGLQQYARKLAELGFADLEPLARLRDQETLDLVEHLNVHPGHHLRLGRALDCLRVAAKDGAAKEDWAGEKAALVDEQTRQRELVRQQDRQIQEAAAQVRELEILLEDRTKQTFFLTEQLQNVIAQAEADRVAATARIAELEAAAKEAAGGDPPVAPLSPTRRRRAPQAREMEPVEVEPLEPETARHVEPVDGLAVSLLRSFDAPAGALASLARSADVLGQADRACSESEVYASDYESDGENDHENTAPCVGSPQGSDGPVVFASPCVAKRKHKVAKPNVAAVRASLDSAPVRQGVCWRFDVDHILRCLARALQDKVICSVREARPHSAKPDVLEASVIFLDPRTTAALQDAPAVPGQPHPLNDIAVRRVPSSWHMYTFLRDAMVGWKLSPEVAVVTLLYAERFEKVTGVSVTPDNWERLAIACMMLASKVWDDDSYENAEFAQICPLYSVDEINTMERVFLKLVDYKVIVGGAEYASTYFRLRVLGARDQANLQAQMEDSEPGARAVLQPLDNVQTEVLAQRGLLKQNEWREKYHAHLQELLAQRKSRALQGGAPIEAEPDPLNWTL